MKMTINKVNRVKTSKGNRRDFHECPRGCGNRIDPRLKTSSGQPGLIHSGITSGQPPSTEMLLFIPLSFPPSAVTTSHLIASS